MERIKDKWLRAETQGGFAPPGKKEVSMRKRLFVLLVIAPMFVGCKGEGAVDTKVETLGRASGPVDNGLADMDAPGAMPPRAATGGEKVVITGKVLETIDASRYTYIRILSDSGEEVWSAVPQIKLKEGEPVELVQSLVMKDFESKTLNRVFPSVVFGVLRGQEVPTQMGTGRGQ